MIYIDETTVMPNTADVKKLAEYKAEYEAAQSKPDRDVWNKQNFNKTPWGISYNLSKKKHTIAVDRAKAKGWKNPLPKDNIAIQYFIIAVGLGWDELIVQLKRTIKLWGYTSADMQDAKAVWLAPANAQKIADMIGEATASIVTESWLVEAVEKHETLNPKLFTKEELLKETVRKKMLEIVDEFLDNLQEQEIEIEVDDILFIGSSASYNYTKDSDIDLHIIADTKDTSYPEHIASALYSAYRTLFNKSLDIKLFDIPVEIYVETENCARVSNGIYSVKKDEWVKKPKLEAIPEYDTKALEELVSKWEKDCKDLIDDIEADKLEDETKVVKLLEDIYEKLRKKGITKGEYTLENLAFKELRNKGYLDKLKEYKNELISKRLSLTERLSAENMMLAREQIAQVAFGQPPVIQDNGMFYLYNLKPSDVQRVLIAIRKLAIVAEANAVESGKYDFSKMALTRIPDKYYNIRGRLIDGLI